MNTIDKVSINVDFQENEVMPLLDGALQFILHQISDKIVTNRRITTLSHITYINLYLVCFCKYVCLQLLSMVSSLLDFLGSSRE